MAASTRDPKPTEYVRSRWSTEVRGALARPAFYPGPVGRVEVRETHISWVFLAGDRAYKLKKPLVLPFLDYGTPRGGARCAARRCA